MLDPRYDLPLQPVSAETYATKYQLKDKTGKAVDADVDATFRRVAKALAAIEQKDKEVWEEKFYKVLANGCVPAGRIMANAGAGEYKPATSTINCLAGETPVLTDEGTFPISALCGRKVKVLNGNGNWSEVEFKSYGQQLVYPIKVAFADVTTPKTVRATAGHRWVLPDGCVVTTEFWLTGGFGRKGFMRLPNIFAEVPANGIKQSAKWRVLEVGGQPELAEVFCCEEAATKSFCLFNGLLTGNCTVSRKLDDSMEGILSALYDAGITLKAGCGIGYCFSTLRPKGAWVSGVGATTSGPMAFMDIFDRMCLTISSAGGRRGAQMATFHINHPDVLDFIAAKREDGRLRQFNMSVLVTDEFMEAVKQDKMWKLRFPISWAEFSATYSKFLILPVNSESEMPDDLIWDTWPGMESDVTIKDEFGRILCKVYKEVKARDIWETIMKSTYDYAEPGVLFIDTVTRDNNNWWCETITASNPCVTGDTLIAVAGGEPTPIKDLTEKGVDFPVYCYNWQTKEIEVSMARNPRKTGINHAIYKVTLDDGSVIRANAQHKLYLKNGEKREIQDLKAGDSLVPFLAQTRNNRQGSDGATLFVPQLNGRYVPEYHLLLNYKHGRKLRFGRGIGKLHCHHIDGNHFNNDLANLEALLHEQHSSFHLTANNPMQNWWKNFATEERKDEYRARMSLSVSGEGNGMYGKVHSASTKEKIGAKTVARFKDEAFKRKHSESLSKAMTPERRQLLSGLKLKDREEIVKQCPICGGTFAFSRIIGSNVTKTFCSTTCISKYASDKAVEKGITESSKQQRIVSCKKFANSDVGKNCKSIAGKASLVKRALKCGSQLIFSGEAINKDTWDSLKSVLHKVGIKPAIGAKWVDAYWKGDWSQFEKECREYNHKVVSVTPDGVEDVYNVTVDKHHNYFIITKIKMGEGDVMSSNLTLSGILTPNCGEQMLPPEGSCLLGSINLTHFVRGAFTDDAEFDWDVFTEAVRVFTRMLDNVVEINGLPVAGQRAEIIHKRRHGMGIFGLGSALAMLQKRYGSLEAVEFTARVMREIAFIGLVEGVALAKEKGPAPIMDTEFVITEEMLQLHPELHWDGYNVGDVIFGKVLWARYSAYLDKFRQDDYCQNKGVEALLKEAEKCGCRFTHHTSIAPTGTISLTFGNNVDSGIEPAFSHSYFRNITVQGKRTRQQQEVMSYELLLWRKLMEEGVIPQQSDLPDYFSVSDTVTPSEHVTMQAAAQYWIDSATSKTVNCPTDMLYEQFKDLYMEAFEKGCKGVTTFRFNPTTVQGVLVKGEDLEKTLYKFYLDDGSVVVVNGTETLEYEGEEHNAAMLYDSIKEGRYASGY